jgi:hypothetical protein
MRELCITKHRNGHRGTWAMVLLKPNGCRTSAEGDRAVLAVLLHFASFTSYSRWRLLSLVGRKRLTCVDTVIMYARRESYVALCR